MSAIAPSGWCSPCVPGAHKTCQGRIDNPKIRLECTCPGHPKKGMHDE